MVLRLLRLGDEILALVVCPLCRRVTAPPVHIVSYACSHCAEEFFLPPLEGYGIASGRA